MTHRGCMLTEAISAQSSGTTGPCSKEKKTREVQMAEAGTPRGSVGTSMLAFCLHCSEVKGEVRKEDVPRGYAEHLHHSPSPMAVNSTTQILKHRNVEKLSHFFFSDG